MASPSPPPLTLEQRRAREGRIERIARELGFIGIVEYRHLYSRAGGAQYGQARVARDDRLLVFAEAFERDADPEEFSLTAILAHERGHQILVRHPRIAKRVAGRVGDVGEEILASLLGSMICRDEADRDALVAKAAAELVARGVSAGDAVAKLQQLRDVFEALL